MRNIEYIVGPDADGNYTFDNQHFWGPSAINKTGLDRVYLTEKQEKELDRYMQTDWDFSLEKISASITQS